MSSASVIPRAQDLANSVLETAVPSALQRVIEALRVKLANPSEEDRMHGNVSEGFSVKLLRVPERVELIRLGYGVTLGSGGVNYVGEAKSDQVYVTCPLPRCLRL